MAAFNHTADGKVQVGRQHTGHRLAMLAVAQRCAVTLRTVGRWQMDHRRAVDTGGLVGQELKEIMSFNSERIAEIVEEIDARLRMGAKQDAADVRPLPEQVAEAILRALHKHKLDEPNRCDPTTAAAVAKALMNFFERNGLTIVPLAKLAVCPRNPAKGRSEISENCKNNPVALDQPE